jgi:predicted site-specific integrase-resolvase
MKDSLISVGQAARITGLAQCTIRRYFAEGILPGIQAAPAKKVRVWRSAVEALIEPPEQATFAFSPLARSGGK